MGHIAKNCPSKPPRKCYNCGETGHVKAGCPSPRVDNVSKKPLQCDECGGHHRKRDCSALNMTQGMAPKLLHDKSGRVDIINSALEKFAKAARGKERHSR